MNACKRASTAICPLLPPIANEFQNAGENFFSNWRSSLQRADNPPTKKKFENTRNIYGLTLLLAIQVNKSWPVTVIYTHLLSWILRVPGPRADANRENSGACPPTEDSIRRRTESGSERNRRRRACKLAPILPHTLPPPPHPLSSIHLLPRPSQHPAPPPPPPHPHSSTRPAVRPRTTQRLPCRW